MNRRGVRIVVGHLTENIVLYLLLLAAFTTSGATLCHAAEVVLPFVNTSDRIDDNFRTNLVIENLSDRDVSFGASTLPPFSAKRYVDWDGDGLAVRAFILPPELRAYVEIIPPRVNHATESQTIVVHPMSMVSPNTYRQVLGLRYDGYSSFLTVFAPPLTQMSIQCFDSKGNSVRAGIVAVAADQESMLVDCPVNATRLKVMAGAPIYVLPIRTKATSGEWVVLPLREVITD